MGAEQIPVAGTGTIVIEAGWGLITITVVAILLTFMMVGVARMGVVAAVLPPEVIQLPEEIRFHLVTDLLPWMSVTALH